MKAPQLPIYPGVTPGVPLRGEYVLTDSGAITMFRQAEHRKPGNLLARIGRQVALASPEWVNPRQTTQQGSEAASPSTYFQTLWPQRFEKSQYVQDCYLQYLGDPTCFKSVNMYAYEAVRGGVKIRIAGTGALQKRAQAIADQYVKIWDVERLNGAAKTAILSGDLFLAITIYDSRVVDFLTLPSVAMERNTDDADKFIDPKRAFSQLDTMSWNDVATFPLWQVHHTRWNYLPGQKYGIPEIMPGRRLARILELCEAAKVTQAMVRSPIRYHWKLGSPEIPATPAEVRDIMAINGFIEGKREAFNPLEQARDIFTSGTSDISVLEGDQNVHQMDHIKYILDRYCNGLPTPRQIMPLGSENINRDVLDRIEAQWKLDTRRVNDALDGPVKYFLQIAFALAGINPDQIEYETIWSKSTSESEADLIASVVELKEAKLLSQRTGVTMMQEYTRVADVDAEIKQIEKEEKQETDREVAKRAAGVTTGDRLSDEGGASPTSPNTKRAPKGRT